MKSLSASDITRRPIDWDRLIDAAGRALVSLSTGTADAPLRSSLPLAEGQLLTMPGRIHDESTATVKLVSVVHSNTRRNLATIQGLAVVFDAVTGAPIATLDGAALTAVRTGAVSAAAVRALGGGEIRSMALLGAGGQAAWQARAISAVCRLERLSVWSPTAENRERIARILHRELGAEVSAMESCRAATVDADLICCTTTARAPFLHEDMLKSGRVLVIAIGAFTPEMAEVGVSVFRRAGRVFVDDVGAVLHEGGDVLAALRARAIRRGDVIPTGSVIDGAVPVPHGVTVFKSVGSAVEDAAVAQAILEMAS